MRKPTQRDLDAMRVNPNPRLVWLMNYAIDEIVAKIGRQSEYADWLNWAAAWKTGRRQPQTCVDVAHRCFANKDEFGQINLVSHTLGQLAWGAKEACYSSPTSGWLVIRYIADAMCAFGVAFPDKAVDLLGSPTIDGDPVTDEAMPQITDEMAARSARHE